MKTQTISIIILSLILSSGIALAGASSSANSNVVDLDGVQMSGGEFETLKAMVSGKYIPRTDAVNKVEPIENLGGVSMTLTEMNMLRSMVSGDYVTQPHSKARQEEQPVDLGVVSMPRREYEKLKTMVSDDHHAILPSNFAKAVHSP